MHGTSLAFVSTMVARVLDRHFDLEFRADPVFVGYAVELARQVLRYHGISACDDMLIVLTEMLRAAMQDELGVRAGKPIRVHVDLDARRHYRLVVEDSGRALAQLRPAAPGSRNTCSVATGIGRSFLLIHRLADEIVVSERGDSVTVSGRFTGDSIGRGAEARTANDEEGD